MIPWSDSSLPEPESTVALDPLHMQITSSRFLKILALDHDFVALTALYNIHALQCN